MSIARGVLVVGASVAAGALVTQLRAEGYAGTITVVDEDPDSPYDRPPLSKEFLAAADERPEASWWGEGCDLVRATALSLDPAVRAVEVRRPDGESATYAADHVVLATGAAPVRLPWLPAGAVTLRTAAEARALRPYLAAGARIAVLGAGTIGTELASTLVAAGAEVTLLDQASRPLERFLAGHLGAESEAWIRDAGVDLRLRCAVDGVTEHGGRWLVSCGDLAPLEVDLVVSAVGTRPSTGWLAGSGLDLADGVGCDIDGRVLDAQRRPVTGVHAIGDVASWATCAGPRRRREDWTSAQRQGRHVAQVIAGTPPAQLFEDELDYFWTHQFGRRIQVLGAPAPDAHLVMQSQDPERRSAFYRLERGGEPVAWIAVNAPREFAMAMRSAAR